MCGCGVRAPTDEKTSRKITEFVFPCPFPAHGASRTETWRRARRDVDLGRIRRGQWVAGRGRSRKSQTPATAPKSRVLSATRTPTVKQISGKAEIDHRHSGTRHKRYRTHSHVGFVSRRRGYWKSVTGACTVSRIWNAIAEFSCPEVFLRKY